MPQSISSRSRSALAATALLVLASLVLAACGGSSATTSTTATATTNASATGTTTTGTTKAPSGAPAADRGRFLAVRECLQKNGIVLPKRKPGQAPGAGSPRVGFPGGGPALPKGVTAAQYQAALKKCGGGLPGRRFGNPANRFKTPAFRKTLATFAACLRSNGVNLPPPNTSGKGPIFNTKGVNVAGAKFRAAQVKCAGVLRSGLRASPGTAKAGAPGSAPPTG